jgi:hypothetical protein
MVKRLNNIGEMNSYLQPSANFSSGFWAGINYYPEMLTGQDDFLFIS